MITIDFQEINGGKIHECVAEFFSPVAMISVERHYVSVLAQLWGTPWTSGAIWGRRDINRSAKADIFLLFYAKSVMLFREEKNMP